MDHFFQGPTTCSFQEIDPAQNFEYGNDETRCQIEIYGQEIQSSKNQAPDMSSMEDTVDQTHQSQSPTASAFPESPAENILQAVDEICQPLK